MDLYLELNDESVVEADNVSETLTAEFADLLTTLSGLKNVVGSLSTRLKVLQKKYDKELRTALKKKKRRVANPNRKPSGFVKPTLITDTLALFLDKQSKATDPSGAGVPAGTLMARTEVTREINKYIRSNNLQDPQNGRIIRPDPALRSLLNVPVSEELTYFNLQRYMSPHFVKTGPVVASA